MLSYEEAMRRAKLAINPGNNPGSEHMIDWVAAAILQEQG